MKKLFAALTTALLAFSLVVAAAPTALATPSTNEGVCTGLNSGKIDTSGSPLSVTVTAPAGMQITGYCVKAGSIKQGNGPEYVTLSPPVAQITFAHSSGKAVSHYSVSWEPIPTPTPLVASADVSVTEATCDAPATLTLGAVTNASWGGFTDVVGPGAYSVTAVAADGSEFPGGAAQKTFTGTLNGPNSELCDEEEPDLATASLSFIDETCFAAQQLDLANFLTSNATFGSDTDLSALGYRVVATADGDAEFAVGDGDAGNLTQKTFTGTLNGPNSELCDEEEPDLATASLSFIDETCFAAQQLDLANFLTSNATFGSDTDLSALGYRVVATADGDAEFAVGDGDAGNLTQKTFTGTLADTDTEKCQKAIPGDPVVTPQTCVAGVLVSGSIWVDLQDGLTYTITNNGTNVTISPVTTATTELPPGNYTASVVANPGYVLSGADSWPYTVEITAPVNCELVTPPTPPRVDITCEASGSYTLPTAEGVIWRVDGDVVEPGTYKVFFAKTVTITAVPDSPEYGFEAEVLTEWVYTFTDAADCELITHPLVTPADVTVKSPTCTTTGSYTIPATEGVLWSIGTRSVLPGTYEVTSPQRITVVASPDAPDYGFEFGVKTEWPMTFTAVNSSLCGDLTTLALTGANGAIINIGLSLAAGLVLLGGAGIYARRRYLNSSN